MPNGQAQLGQQPQGEKPFYKKAWFWIIVVLLLAISGLGSNSSNSSSDNSSSSQERPASIRQSTTSDSSTAEETTTTTTNSEYEDLDLDSFIGLTVAEADTQAQAEGYSIRIVNRIELNSRDKEYEPIDYTKSYQKEGEDKDYISTWTVAEVEKDGTELTLFAKTPTQIAKEENEAAGKEMKNYVMDACENYGRRAYPYGFTTHIILGYQEGPIRQDDGSYRWLVEATVTNAFNAEYRGYMQCVTEGDENGMTVRELEVY